MSAFSFSSILNNPSLFEQMPPFEEVFDVESLRKFFQEHEHTNASSLGSPQESLFDQSSPKLLLDETDCLFSNPDGLGQSALNTASSMKSHFDFKLDLDFSNKFFRSETPLEQHLGQGVPSERAKLLPGGSENSTNTLFNGQVANLAFTVKRNPFIITKIRKNSAKFSQASSQLDLTHEFSHMESLTQSPKSQMFEERDPILRAVKNKRVFIIKKDVPAQKTLKRKAVAPLEDEVLVSKKVHLEPKRKESFSKDTTIVLNLAQIRQSAGESFSPKGKGEEKQTPSNYNLRTVTEKKVPRKFSKNSY